MNILVTLNSNYLHPLRVMLWSMFFNNREGSFHIFLMHSSIPPEDVDALRRFVVENGHQLSELKVREESFQDAPVPLHYTKEMYYRLLAFRFLPERLDRILYLDPDILVINSIAELYHTEMGDHLFAAAYHKNMPVKELNKFRLKAYEMEEYYNSGVLLMNLALQREKIREEEIYEFVSQNKSRLVLPDQDILNVLYAKEIKRIDELKYNYDTRYYLHNKLVSSGTIDMEYIMRHTSILHFCGKKKPWLKNYNGKFYSLYKHYETLTLRFNGPPEQKKALPRADYVPFSVCRHTSTSH